MALQLFQGCEINVSSAHFWPMIDGRTACLAIAVAFL
jgi:hypothetical protein